LSLEQENVILKRSFLSLYKQIALLKKEKEDLLRKYEQQRSEFKSVKMMNKYLLEKEYNNN